MKEFYQVPFLPQDGVNLLPLEHREFSTREEAEKFAREHNIQFIYHYADKCERIHLK